MQPRKGSGILRSCMQPRKGCPPPSSSQPRKGDHRRPPPPPPPSSASVSGQSRLIPRFIFLSGPPDFALVADLERRAARPLSRSQIALQRGRSRRQLSVLQSLALRFTFGRPLSRALRRTSYPVNVRSPPLLLASLGHCCVSKMERTSAKPWVLPRGRSASSNRTPGCRCSNPSDALHSETEGPESGNSDPKQPISSVICSAEPEEPMGQFSFVYLSIKYYYMPDIVKKACQKLLKQQEVHRSKLLTSYKNMEVAEELVHMLILELNLRRLLVVDLLSVSCKVPKANSLHWSEELYPGEFGDLRICNLFSEETCQPVYPRLHGQKSAKPPIQRNKQPDHDILQVYLTTWLTEVNIDTHRMDEIYAEVGEEIHCRLSWADTGRIL